MKPACGVFPWVLSLAGLLSLVSVLPLRGAADLSAPGPWLVFDIALGWGMGPADTEGRGGVRFEVQASDGGPFERLFRANYARLGWYPYAVDVSRYAGRDVRFRFLVEHIEGRIMMDYPHWGNPRLVTGPLVGEVPPTEVFRFAMAPAQQAAALLQDGSEVPLAEADPVFEKGLVTPGRLDRERMLLVYAGDNYICVPGRPQPGLYMGVSMSVDYLRIGAGPDRSPWLGPMPPPVFAEWTVRVPAVAALSTARASVSREPAAGGPRQGPLQVLQTRTDVCRHRPGLEVEADPGQLSLHTAMGPQTDIGWAFAALELMGPLDLRLGLERQGESAAAGPNAFRGLVVDYHTPRGYQDRVWLGLGVGSADRYDLRPADWNLDGPPLTLSRTMGMRSSFVDLSREVRRARSRLRLRLERYAPPDWDGRIWLAAGVQDMPPGSGLTVHIEGEKAPAPAEPADSEPITLADGLTRLAICPRTGAILGGWDVASGRQVLARCSDRYTVDTEHDVTRASELLDRVRTVESLALDGGPGLVVTCENAALPDTILEKRYRLLPDRQVAKRLSARTEDSKGFFFHWDAETALAPDFMAASSRAGDLLERQVVAQGKVVQKTEAVPAEQVSAGDSPVVTARDFSLGLSAYRCAVNDRFVLRGTCKSLPTGWLTGVFVDYLRADRAVSGETRWVLFSGDFTVADRRYQALPEVQALWQFRRPEWPQRVVGDAMYLGPVETYPFYRACAPDLVTATIWFLNPPWGNWAPDSDPPKGLHPDVKGIAAGWRKEFPNARVSAYTNALFDDRSDISRQHPDFGVRDLEGQPITSGIASDSGGRPSFYFQIANPECREYLLTMHTSKFREWGFDFFYMDGPGFGAEVPDWATRRVAQSYDWLDYFRTLRERLQSVRPDAAIFVNGANTPYADLGYIEYRDEQWQALSGPGWRPLALELFRAKLNEPPGAVTVPTYGNPGADPAISAYTMLYGWAGSLSQVGRLPWMREARRYRGTRLVPEAVEPRWWRGSETFEAYGFQHGDSAVVNLLDHGTEARQVRLTIGPAALGLHPGRPLSAELRLMNDTASEEKPDPANPANTVRVYRNTTAVTVSELFPARPCPVILDLTLPTRPMLVTTVVLSHPPEARP